MAEDATNEYPIYNQGFRWQLAPSTNHKLLVELIREQNITLSAHPTSGGASVEYMVEQASGTTRTFRMSNLEDTVISFGKRVSARAIGGYAGGSIFVHPVP